MENVYAESDFWVTVATTSSALIVAISIFAKSLVSLIEDDANRGLENKELRNVTKISSVFLLLVGLSDLTMLIASIFSLKNHVSTILPTSIAAPLLGATFFAFVVIVLVVGLMEMWKLLNDHSDKRVLDAEQKSGQFPGYPVLVELSSLDSRVASSMKGQTAEGKAVALAPGLYTAYKTQFSDLNRYYQGPFFYGDTMMMQEHFPMSRGRTWGGVQPGSQEPKG